MKKQPEKLPVITTVSVCIFRRKQFSKLERGIILGHGDLIVDRNNKIVEAPIWTYTILPYEGLLRVEL